MGLETYCRHTRVSTRPLAQGPNYSRALLPITAGPYFQLQLGPTPNYSRALPPITAGPYFQLQQGPTSNYSEGTPQHDARLASHVPLISSSDRSRKRCSRGEVHCATEQVCITGVYERGVGHAASCLACPIPPPHVCRGARSQLSS